MHLPSYHRRASVVAGCVLALAFASCDSAAPTSDAATGSSTIELDGATAAEGATAASRGRNGVAVCHKRGPNGYERIEVAEPALPAHLAHGDARPGEPVPDVPGHVFDGACVPEAGLGEEPAAVCPCFDADDLQELIASAPFAFYVVYTDEADYGGRTTGLYEESGTNNRVRVNLVYGGDDEPDGLSCNAEINRRNTQRYGITPAEAEACRLLIEETGYPCGNDCANCEQDPCGVPYTE